MIENSTAPAMKVSVVTIIVNIILSAIKFATSIFTHSSAMLSDAVHSASDVFSTFVVIIGVAIANKESDENHKYGHEKIESIAGIILSLILFCTGVGIGAESLKKIFFDNENIQVPGGIALWAAILSIAVKEWMYQYTKSTAKKINSGALMADAWHHRSDALSSIGSFIGILGARAGMPIMDSIAGAIISAFIIKASLDIFKDATDKLTDKSCDIKTEQQMRELIMKQSGVMGIDDMRTRLFGNKIYVDVEISADGNQSLYQAHETAQNVHDKLEKSFPLVKHCMVHVNPYEPNNC